MPFYLKLILKVNKFPPSYYTSVFFDVAKERKPSLTISQTLPIGKTSGLISLLIKEPNLTFPFVNSFILTAKSPSNPQDELKLIAVEEYLAQDLHGDTASLELFFGMNCAPVYGGVIPMFHSLQVISSSHLVHSRVTAASNLQTFPLSLLNY